MRKTIYLFIVCCAILTTGADLANIKLARLTVINKSGLPVELRLTGVTTGQFYYLRIPTGDRLLPTETVYTVLRDEYQSQLYYVELWDPVYGSKCGSKSMPLDIRHNVRLTVLECELSHVPPGEAPAIIKYGFSAGKRKR